MKIKWAGSGFYGQNNNGEWYKIGEENTSPELQVINAASKGVRFATVRLIVVLPAGAIRL